MAGARVMMLGKLSPAFKREGPEWSEAPNTNPLGNHLFLATPSSRQMRNRRNQSCDERSRDDRREQPIFQRPSALPPVRFVVHSGRHGRSRFCRKAVTELGQDERVFPRHLNSHEPEPRSSNCEIGLPTGLWCCWSSRLLLSWHICADTPGRIETGDITAVTKT